MHFILITVQLKFYKTSAPKQDFIYGVHPILEAIQSGKTIDKLIIKKGMRNPIVDPILRHCRKMNIPVQDVPIEKLNKITGKAHQGIIAFLSLVDYTDADTIVPFLFENGENPLIVILDRITDVRNFGAICRSAVCAGAQAIIVPSKGAAQINEDAVKSSAGAIHQIMIARAHNLKDTIKLLKDSGVQIVGITEKAEGNYYATDFSVPTAIVMGSEEDGISPEYLKLCDTVTKIPMNGNLDSLNVSVATGIMLFEVVRQRNTQS